MADTNELTLSSLQQQLSTLRQRDLDREGQLREQEGQLREQEGQLREHERQLNTLQQRDLEWERQLSNVNATLTNVHNENNNLRKDLQHLSSCHGRLYNDHLRTKDRLTKVEESLDVRQLAVNLDRALLISLGAAGNFGSTVEYCMNQAIPANHNLNKLAYTIQYLKKKSGDETAHDGRPLDMRHSMTHVTTVFRNGYLFPPHQAYTDTTTVTGLGNYGDWVLFTLRQYYGDVLDGRVGDRQWQNVTPRRDADSHFHLGFHQFLRN